jgi:hypothetical protein
MSKNAVTKRLLSIGVRAATTTDAARTRYMGAADSAGSD